MKVMIKILEDNRLRAYYYKEFNDVSEIIMYCTSKTNGRYTYDFEVVKGE